MTAPTDARPWDAPEPGSEPVVDVSITTRYGVEVHHHRGEAHVAGPTCPCGPEMTWRTK